MELWRKNLYVAWIAEMIAITGFSFIMPFIPFYVQELGITDVGQAAQWAGVLIGIPAVVMTIFSPIWGSLADVYGRKIMVERAMFGSAISIFFMASVTNVYQLLFFRILQAALTGTVAACIALVSSSSPPQKMGYSLGLMQTAIFTGTCIGPLLGGVIADNFGYRNSFRITSILLFIAVLLVFFLVKENFHPLSKKEISSNNFWKNLRIVFSSHQLVIMVFVFFLVQFSVMIVNPVFALFMEETFTSIKSISSIEGITGIAHWDETEKSKPDYLKFSKQMTEEVKAACKGAINAGVEEIWIKDAHGSGRNIIAADLPPNIKLIRGWSGHPFSMVQELDESFNALIFIGYHSCGSSNANPLSHTMSSTTFNYIKLNDKLASEFSIYSYAAASVGVPLVFLSGDEGLCKEVNAINKNIRTVAVKKGIGNSVISIHPQLAIKKIKEGVESVLKEDINKCKINLPEHFKFELSFKDHAKAFKTSFYPGVKQISSTNVVFESDNYFEVLRMFSFRA